MVPVSIRTGDESRHVDQPGVRASSPTCRPTVDDPIERVARCREAMDAAKRQFELVPAEALVDITQYSSPVVATAAIRLASQLRLGRPGGDRRSTSIISNVPGPRQPLYFSGAQLEQYIPVSTIAEGMGLNITVHSYLDELTCGLIACRELVPDLWEMIDLHIAEIDRLFEATGAEWAEPPRPAPPRRGPVVRQARRTGGATKATKAAKRRRRQRPRPPAKRSRGQAQQRPSGRRAPRTPSARRSGRRRSPPRRRAAAKRSASGATRRSAAG